MPGSDLSSSTHAKRSPLKASQQSTLGGHSRKLAAAKQSSSVMMSTNTIGSTHTRTSRASRATRAKQQAGAADTYNKMYSRQQAIAVYDEDGNDVTPLLLVQPAANLYRNEKEALRLFQSNSSSQASTTASMKSLDSQSVMEAYSNLESALQFSGLSINTAGGGEGGRQHRSSQFGTAASASELEDGDHASTSSVGSVDEDDTVGSSSQGSSYFLRKTKTKLDTDMLPAKESLEGADLAKPVTITLTETETIWLLQLPSSCVGLDPAEEAAVKANNARYQQVKNAHLTGDNFVHRGMQTFGNIKKNREVQSGFFKTQNMEVQVEPWEIHDSYVAVDEKAVAEEPEVPGQALAAVHAESMAIGAASHSTLASTMGSTGIVGDAPQKTGTNSTSVQDQSSMASGQTSVSEAVPKQNATSGSTTNTSKAGASLSNLENGSLDKLNAKRLRESLRVMESAILHNNYNRKIALYRNTDLELDDSFLRPEEAEEDDDGEPVLPEHVQRQAGKIESTVPSVQFLWNFKCELSKDRHVTGIAWNTKDSDIIAVSYGERNGGADSSSGLVLCWSLNNVEYPGRVYRSNAPATSVAYSKTMPNLLACGYADGHIRIYDVRNDDDVPVLDTSTMSNKHHDPVWELQWVESTQLQESETKFTEETLMSISTDGRVSQWLVKKGMESVDLISLKHVVPQTEGKSKDSAKASFVSRLNGGLSVNFNPDDSNTYLVALEDGAIHRCSSTYNEQYLDSYFGHSGPVYRVRWSPFLPTVFMSCSADWTVRLWHQDHAVPILRFQSGREPVNDIAWSPFSSTVFGTVVEDGKIEIWDLANSLLDPLIVHTALDRKLYRISFAPDAATFATGDNIGAVTMYKLRNFKSDTLTAPQKAVHVKALKDLVDVKASALKASSAALNAAPNE